MSSDRSLWPRTQAGKRAALVHVAVDIVAIVALTVLAWRELVPGELAAVGILAVQGAYVLQMHRSKRSGNSDPPPPSGALVALLGTLLGRRIIG